MPTKITADIRYSIVSAVGAANAFSGADKAADYGHDEFSLREIAHDPDLVLRPGTAEEVAAVLRIADAHRVPVTPRGGATGLCGGCVPGLRGRILFPRGADQ